MRRIHMTREFFIPKTPGTVKVADKQSDAVAYIWTNMKGQPGATVFVGKQAKPLFAYRYRLPENRDNAVRQAFENRRAALARVTERRKAKAAWVNTWKPGDIFRTCWGYEQTNVEYFEVIETKGKYCTLREIAQERSETRNMSGSCVPLPGSFIGEPIRRLATERGFKIDDVRRAWPVERQIVGGVPVIQPSGWSAYH